MWSDKLIEDTKENLENLTFGSRDGKIYFKHPTEKYGFMYVKDLYTNWTIHYLNKAGSVTFGSMDEMVDAGWVLD